MADELLTNLLQGLLDGLSIQHAVPSETPAGQMLSLEVVPEITGSFQFPTVALQDVLIDLDIFGRNVKFADTDLTDENHVGGMTAVDPTTVTSHRVALNTFEREVKFADTDLADENPEDGLPIYDLTAVPPTVIDGVPGTVGKLAGSLPLPTPTADPQGAVAGIIGRVTGTLKLPVPTITAVAPRLNVRWEVREGTTKLKSGEHFDAPSGLGNAALSLIFYPDLTMELKKPVQVQKKARDIYVTVEITAGDVKVGPKEFPPISTTVPAIPVPTILALCVEENFRGPTLLMVPSTSPLNSLDQIADKVRELKSLLAPLSSVVQLAGMLTGLTELANLLGSEPHKEFRQADAVANLNDITLIQNPWWMNDMEAEDEVSSVMLIGPQKRTVQCFNKRDFDVDDGAFTVTAGTRLFAGIRTLHAIVPSSEPVNTVVINKDVPGVIFRPTSFGDELSSVRFGFS